VLLILRTSDEFITFSYYFDTYKEDTLKVRIMTTYYIFWICLLEPLRKRSMEVDSKYILLDWLYIIVTYLETVSSLIGIWLLSYNFSKIFFLILQTRRFKENSLITLQMLICIWKKHNKLKDILCSNMIFENIKQQMIVTSIQSQLKCKINIFLIHTEEYVTF
jgi:hypothetical protein